MPMSYAELIDSYSGNSYFADNKYAKHIYEDVICSDKNRMKMVAFAEVGITPLSAVAAEVLKVSEQEGSDFSLDQKVSRQFVGRMVAAAIQPFGYVPDGRARVVPVGATPFNMARTYVMDASQAKEYVYKEIRQL